MNNKIFKAFAITLLTLISIKISFAQEVRTNSDDDCEKVINISFSPSEGVYDITESCKENQYIINNNISEKERLINELKGKIAIIKAKIEEIIKQKNDGVYLINKQIKNAYFNGKKMRNVLSESMAYWRNGDYKNESENYEEYFKTIGITTISLEKLEKVLEYNSDLSTLVYSSTTAYLTAVKPSEMSSDEVKMIKDRFSAYVNVNGYYGNFTSGDDIWSDIRADLSMFEGKLEDQKNINEIFGRNIFPKNSDETGKWKINDSRCQKQAINCINFTTHKEAQDTFEYCGGIYDDIYGLDRDKDGLACESLIKR